MCSPLKGFLLIVPLIESNQRQVNIFILTLRCAVRLGGAHHWDCLRGMLPFVVCCSWWSCTPLSSTPWWNAYRRDFLCNLELLTPRYVVHCRDWLRGVQHTADIVREMETEFENTLHCLSGSQMGIMKKMEVENLLTLSPQWGGEEERVWWGGGGGVVGGFARVGWGLVHG